MESYEPLILILSVIVVLGYGFFSYSGHEKILNKYIEDKFAVDNLSVDSISILNITEKIRYGIPILPYYNFYRYSIPFVFLGLTVSLHRKIELTDRNKNEFTKYVAIDLRGSVVIEFVEIDNYGI